MTDADDILRAREGAGLDKLYVRCDLRRRDHGSRLLRHVEGRARALGFTGLHLRVNRDNGSAVGA